MPRTGEVIGIYIAADKGLPMVQQDHIHAIKDAGLGGDRYATGNGAYSKSKRETVRHVSLIAVEAIDAANAMVEEQFTPEDTRRNILTRDIDLNELVGVEFTVGGVAMLGIELCDPCDRPSKLSGKKGFNEAFQNKGGLRAKILLDGEISNGDVLVVRQQDNYQPTEADLNRLQEERLTLEQALQFKRPSDEELAHLAEFGMTLIDAILYTDVKKNIRDALAQVAPLRYPHNSQPSQDDLSRAHEHFIHILELRVEGNPYPGKDFSLAKAQEIIDSVKATLWTLENFTSEFDRLLVMVDSKRDKLE